MVKVAFLGLGNMGGAMARRLAEAGHSMAVYNRSPEKLRHLVEQGAVAVNSPAEAVADADAVFSMVTNDDASRAIWTGPAGALSRIRPGTLAIESSTVSYGWIKALGRKASEAGAAFLDCPVAGRPDAAAAGELTVFAGGDAADLERARPLLSAFSKNVVHLGPPANGLAFKLLYNLFGAVQVAALAEAMAACAAVGIDLEVAAKAFSDGATGSPHVRRHGPVMASGRYARPPQFTPGGRVKDLTYGIELTDSCGGSTALAQTARSLFEGMISLDDPETNDIELVEVLRRRVGADRSRRRL